MAMPTARLRTHLWLYLSCHVSLRAFFVFIRFTTLVVRTPCVVLLQLRLQVVHRFEGAAPAEYVLELVDHYFHGGPKPRDVRSLMQ